MGGNLCRCRYELSDWVARACFSSCSNNFGILVSQPFFLKQGFIESELTNCGIPRPQPLFHSRSVRPQDQILRQKLAKTSDTPARKQLAKLMCGYLVLV